MLFLTTSYVPDQSTLGQRLCSLSHTITLRNTGRFMAHLFAHTVNVDDANGRTGKVKGLTCSGTSPCRNRRKLSRPTAVLKQARVWLDSQMPRGRFGVGPARQRRYRPQRQPVGRPGSTPGKLWPTCNNLLVRGWMVCMKVCLVWPSWAAVQRACRGCSMPTQSSKEKASNPWCICASRYFINSILTAS